MKNSLPRRSLLSRFGAWSQTQEQIVHQAEILDLVLTGIDLALKISSVLGTLFIFAKIAIAFLPGGPLAHLVGGR